MQSAATVGGTSGSSYLAVPELSGKLEPFQRATLVFSLFLLILQQLCSWLERMDHKGVSQSIPTNLSAAAKVIVERARV